MPLTTTYLFLINLLFVSHSGVSSTGVHHIIVCFMIVISSENELLEYVGYANCIEYKIKVCCKYSLEIPV